MPEILVDHFEIQFAEDDKPAVILEKDTALSTALNATNSPLLFGCRIGICGTCVMEVEPNEGESLPPPSEFEAETLSMYAPDNPRARLACQISACANMRIRMVRTVK